MKIALAIENFNPFAGGAESYAVELAETLIAKGWETHLYGYSWDGVPKGAVFHRIPKPPKLIPPFIRLLHFAYQHRAMVSRKDFDVVLGFGNTIYMSVYQSHGGVHYYSNLRKLDAVTNPIVRVIKRISLFLSPKYHVRGWIESAAFRIKPAPILIAISEMIRDDYTAFFRTDKSDIRIVYNGIDEGKFRRSHGRGLRKKLGFCDDRVIFLFMAYDFRKKGVKYLIQAAGELRKKVGTDRFGVVIVGREPETKLRLFVKKLELENVVVFPGATKKPAEFYGACDVFVLPTFYDACSLVVFEAMMAELPVITTKWNGAAGIIENGLDGFVLSDPADVDALCSTMEKCLDKEFLSRAAEAAGKKALNYTLRQNHKKMLAIFDEAARQRRLDSVDRPREAI